MEQLFTMVDNFDKVEGYDQWLANQIQPKTLAIVEEESSEELVEEKISKPPNLKILPKMKSLESPCN